MTTPMLVPRVPRAPDLLTVAEWSQLMTVLGLPRRESEVLRCAFYDDSTKGIAHQLQIAEATVNTYRERIFKRLAIGTMSHAVGAVFAIYLQLGDSGDDPPEGACGPADGHTITDADLPTGKPEHLLDLIHPKRERTR